MLKLLLALVVLVGCVTALEIELEKEARSFDKVEAAVKEVAKAVVKDETGKVESEGQAAIRRIRARWVQLQSRRQECDSKPTTAQRDDCVAEWRKDTRRVRLQLKLVKKMEKCVRKYDEDKKKRAKCVKKAAVEYLKLRPIRTTVADDNKVVNAQTKKVFSSAEKGDRAAVKRRVAAIIKALYKRLADIDVQKAKCKNLESAENYKTCIEPVRQKIKKNKKERRAVKKVERCARIKNAKKRVKCLVKAEDALLNLVAPGKPADIPASVDELDAEVVQTADQLIAQIKKTRRSIRDCESGKCRREARQKIKLLKRKVRALKKRFSPRRKCLADRRAARTKEFRARAKEHAELSEIHDAAMECSSAKCTAEEEQEQQRLEKAIMKRRASFTKQWKKLRCPFIAPDNSEPARKKKSKSLKTHNLQSLKDMRQRLVELYAKLDECDNGKCKLQVRNDIDDLIRLIKLLQTVEDRTLEKKRKDHKRRATLHRKLTKYYLLAADCETRRCRIQYRRKLSAITKALAKLDRDELGRVKDSVRNMNKYYRMLQKALKRCPRSNLGHSCRQMVVHAFRAGTELRQKAMLQYLRRVARSNAKRSVLKCKADKACAKKAQDKLAKRLAQIQIRELRIEKRRALRLCELVPNKKKCRADVAKEFARDQKIAAANASKDAKKVVKTASDKVKDEKADDKGKKQAAPAAVAAATPATSAKRSSSATVLSVSVAVLCAVVVALLF